MWHASARTALFAVVVFVVLLSICQPERLGFGTKCIVKARKCTVTRIRYLGRVSVRPVFQDALYHYCLSLYGCQPGKEQVCRNVGRSEQLYPDPKLRRRLIRQCGIWKVPVQFVHDGPLGHYPYFQDT